MARVTDAEVKTLIQTDLSDLSAFIASANLLVSDELKGEGLAQDRLKEIERWLAAHFTAIRDPRVTSESIGDGSASYAGRSTVAMGLKLTEYGQQAIALDPTGNLANSGKRNASLVAL